jgi:hypothetical protein
VTLTGLDKSLIVNNKKIFLGLYYWYQPDTEAIMRLGRKLS